MRVEQSTIPTRRTFLKSVAAAGAALASAGTNQALPLNGNTPSAEGAQSASKGYRKTGHVKAYYASARL